MEHLHSGTDRPCLYPVESHLSLVLGLMFHPDEGGKVRYHEEVLESVTFWVVL